MCGRYATTRSAADLSALFEAVNEVGDEAAPGYNVAPTRSVPVVRISHRRGGRVVSAARWGLVPPWAKDLKIGARMINARAETAATTRAFAPSFARRRCLVPADGWYEWLRRESGKQPYFMTPRDGSVLAFAGLWTARDEPQGRLVTCAVLTTDAVGDLAAVHARMPLVLPQARWESWLDVAAEPDPQTLLAPPPEELVRGLEIRPVGAAVGNVRAQGPELVARVAAAAPGGPPERPADLTLF